jgi:hypothetical protein
MHRFPRLRSTFLLAVVGAALTGCQSTKAQADPASAKWEPDIQKFEAADRDTPPPKGAMLLAGS